MRSIPAEVSQVGMETSGTGARTLVADVHLGLERPEVVGDARPDLAAHLLPRPLLEAAELLVDEHGCVRSVRDGAVALLVVLLWVL
jgi:hypothetical protein